MKWVVDHTRQDPVQAAHKEMVHPGAMGIANGALGIAKWRMISVFFWKKVNPPTLIHFVYTKKCLGTFILAQLHQFYENWWKIYCGIANFYEFGPVNSELFWIMSGSCHLDRASNDEFSAECLFWFFQPTWIADLKVVQITC